MSHRAVEPCNLTARGQRQRRGQGRYGGIESGKLELSEAFAAEQLRAARFALDQFLQQRQSRLELLVLRVDFRRHQQDFRVLIVLVDKTLKAAGRFIGPSQAVQRRSAAIKQP